MTTKKELNTFTGTHAVKDFMNPDNHPYIPLVEIPPSVNPFHTSGVCIFAKLMNQLPLANVKSLPAFNMLFEAEQNGTLNNVHSLIESSSGNTVLSLAVLARIFGIPTTKALVSHEVTEGKLQLLRLLGTSVKIIEEPICPDPNDPESGVYQARVLGEQEGWLNPGQYHNEANPRAHEKWTGPQLWEQTGGAVSLFCAGLGTTGSLIGTSRFLKQKNPNLESIGVVRAANNPVPGVRTEGLLSEISFDYASVLDYVEEVGTIDSFKASLDLCRHGLLVGPSAGFAFAGLCQFLEKNKERLDEFRGPNGEIIAVFIAPDSPLPYLSEYFQFLDETHFPPIEEEELLLYKRQSSSEPAPAASPVPPGAYEITPQEAHGLMYGMPPSDVWRSLNETGTIPLADERLIVFDARGQHQYDHAHLAGSEWINIYDLLHAEKPLLKRLAGKTVLLICDVGNKTAVASRVLHDKGINALNIRGGMVEWSRLDLPRWRPDVCRAT